MTHGRAVLAPLLLSIVAAQVPPAEAKGYAELLTRHVKQGRVDYAAIATGPGKAALEGYLRAVGKAQVPAAKPEAVAFYVDAYNALVIQAVLAHGRPRSVLDVKGFFDAETHLVAGQQVTLDALEKKVLNPLAKDPRTHMVLVCGAVGCPILDATPYAGSNLEVRLDAATRRYLASPAGAVVEPGVLKLSKIFDWYAADFGGPEGVLGFAKAHLPPGAVAQLGAKPRVEFVDYNWTLNQQ